MKKYLVLAFIPLLFGCASHCPLKQQDVPVTEEEFCDVPMPIENCACSYEPQPYREVKHPRVVEEIASVQKRRPCDDVKVLDCPCSNFDTFNYDGFQGQAESKPLTYIPAQPDAYTLLANRTFNRFIKDTYGIYKETPNLKLYVKEPVLKATDLPSGFDEGLETFKMQLKNSHTFQLTDNEDEADYILSTTIDWFDTPSKDVPAIRYIVDMIAKDKTDAGSWSEIVKKADNKSWL